MKRKLDVRWVILAVLAPVVVPGVILGVVIGLVFVRLVRAIGWVIEPLVELVQACRIGRWLDK